jgi:toxin-antitoxin system PIN domain toxin
VIAVDTNVLVYAHMSGSPFHERAKSALAELAEGSAFWAIPSPCLYEFYCVVTHRDIYSPPSTPAQALQQIGGWRSSPTLRVITETHDHLDVMAELARRGELRGSMIYDARVSAICLSHGVHELMTMDRDFTRFPELTIMSLVA